MKTLFSKLQTLLNAIGPDKYRHFALGALLATAALLVPRAFGVANGFALFVSFAAVLGAALYKEYRLDPVPDMRDFLATILGGVVVWAAVSFAIM